MTLIEILVDELARRQWTPGKLAVAANISRQTCYQIVRGERSKPELSTLARLADALSLPRKTLYEAAGYDVDEQPNEHACCHAMDEIVNDITAAYTLGLSLDELMPYLHEARHRGAALRDVIAERLRQQRGGAA